MYFTHCNSHLNLLQKRVKRQLFNEEEEEDQYIRLLQCMIAPNELEELTKYKCKKSINAYYKSKYDDVCQRITTKLRTRYYSTSAKEKEKEAIKVVLPKLGDFYSL